MPNWALSSTAGGRSQRADVWEGDDYWFFQHFRSHPRVEIVDTARWPGWRLEERFLHFYLAQGLVALWRSRRADVVVAHGVQSAVVLLAVRRLLRLGSPPVVVVDVGSLNGGRPDKRVSFGLARWAMRGADGIIWHATVSRSIAAEHAPELLAKGEVVHFGVDASEFEHPASVDGDYAICIGYAKRDWQTLVAAWRLLPGIPLKVVGAPLESTDNADITFVPRVEFVEYRRLVAESRMVVLPIDEGDASWGQMTLLQSFALGKPVVVSDVRPVADYVGPWCVRYAATDSAGLARSVRALWDDAPRRLHLGAAAQRVVLERYTEVAMALSIERIVQRSVSGRE